MPKELGFSTVLFVRVSPAMKAQIEEQAQQSETTASAWVRDVLRRKLRSKERAR